MRSSTAPSASPWACSLVPWMALRSHPRRWRFQWRTGRAFQHLGLGIPGEERFGRFFDVIVLKDVPGMSHEEKSVCWSLLVQ